MSTSSQDVRDRADEVKAHWGDSERGKALAIAACAVAISEIAAALQSFANSFKYKCL